MSIPQTDSLPYLNSELFSLEGIINHFHFIRPLWLLAFIALFLVIFLLKKIRYYQSPWQHFLPKHLANALLENANTSTSIQTPSQTQLWLKPFIIGSCVIVALAGPAWQKLPQPVYQLDRGAVIIMDMSYSMFATDLKPNRVTRARFKAIDLLDSINEGDVGLIAYAGDAFIISPLTQDANNLALLLPSLSPDIMPVHGANALAALTLADQTLKNAGHVSGDIYWFTDDIDQVEISDVYQWANNNNHKLNILGIGTSEGAPIKLSDGQLLKDNKGAIVIPKLPEAKLAGISKRSRGIYHTISNDDSDIKALTAHLTTSLDNDIDNKSDGTSQDKKHEQSLQGDQYLEQGPLLLIIILPFLLSYFRRGSSILAISWLLPLTLLTSVMTYSPNSFAQSSKTAPIQSIENKGSSESSIWRNLWQTPDQQAYQHYQKKDYVQAAKVFENELWKGSAHYKAGEFEQALASFQTSDSASALYNQGNALAQLQKIDEAIDAYKQALIKDPDLQDAKDNLAQLEALKKQQDEQKQEDGDSKENSEDNSQENSQDSSKQNSEQNSDQSSEQSSEQSSDSNPQAPSENEQQSAESDENNEEASEAEKSSQGEESDKEPSTDKEKQALAQQALDNETKETDQKHQKIMNKVTDDPYLLLRNKMRLEYQKRRHEGSLRGETKKW